MKLLLISFLVTVSLVAFTPADVDLSGRHPAPRNCPRCNPLAGCKVEGCDCLRKGIRYTPPTIPENAPRQFPCPPCRKGLCSGVLISCVDPPLKCGPGTEQYVKACPPCNPIAGCQEEGCDCTRNGVRYTPPTIPENEPRPEGCKACVQDICPNALISCMNPPPKCERGSERYVKACPPCNPIAGCQEEGCDCTRNGVRYTPPTIPENEPRPDWCKACEKDVCPNAFILCMNPPPKCEQGSENYVISCPPCNPIAGCQEEGCDCMRGILHYTPPRIPPNAPRPKGCPACEQKVCPNALILCMNPPSPCGPNQGNYVLSLSNFFGFSPAQRFVRLL